jgi:hypothetical protein
MAAWRGSRAGGGEVKVDKSNKGGLVVDGWLRLEVAPAAVPMLLELRRRSSVIQLSCTCIAVHVLTCCASTAYALLQRTHLTPCCNAHASLLNRLAHVLARMVQRTDGDGGGADSLPLLDAVVELMRQQPEPELLPAPAANGGAPGKSKKKKKGAGTRGKQGSGQGSAFAFFSNGSDGLHGGMGGCDW